MKCLGIVGRVLRELNINAEYDKWTGKVPKRYWVYTYIESDNNFETGCKSGIIIIDGYTIGDIRGLEEEKEKIIEAFRDFRTSVDGVTVYLGSADGQRINTYDNEVDRIQININFNEWRVI